jgi:penicillin-binding protein 2
MRAKHQNNTDFAQNGWFVGFTPRRNPDIIVCVLFEGGEHGKLAARLATQVIKAYVDKQQRQPTKMASASGKVEVSSLWTDAGATDRPDKHSAVGDQLQAGRFLVDVAHKKTPLAVAAPGLH